MTYLIRMMLIFVLFGNGVAEASEVSSRVELIQSGESARVHSPECSTGGGMTAADVILKVGATAIDAYTGTSLVSGAMNQMPAGNRQWLKDRFGISDGKSSCMTQCVTYPADAPRSLKISFSETGGDGYSEKISDKASELNGDYGTGWAGVIDATSSHTGKTGVFCATGKNWSHNRNRWFTITAIY